jgi:hypothetical protein
MNIDTTHTTAMSSAMQARALGALDVDGQAVLRPDLEPLWQAHNRASGGTTVYEGESLEVDGIRR